MAFISLPDYITQYNKIFIKMLQYNVFLVYDFTRFDDCISLSKINSFYIYGTK